MTTIRILVADDEPLVRAGLRAILESAEDLAVVGEVDNGADVVEACRRSRPDIVLMDIRMPRLDGLAATAEVHRLANPPAVIVLTTFDADDYVFRALEAGATGFLLKDTPPKDLIHAVRTVAAGGSMLSPGVTRTLIAHYAADHRTDHRRTAAAQIDRLTQREREVVVEVGHGNSNAEIAATLHMSEATVKSHITHLFEKLAVSNRVQLAILAHRAGLVP